MLLISGVEHRRGRVFKDEAKGIEAPPGGRYQQHILEEGEEEDGRRRDHARSRTSNVAKSAK